MNGLHLTGDLSDCRCNAGVLRDSEAFRERCLAWIHAAGFTVLDATFQRTEDDGFTGSVLLTESHVAIHTRPSMQGLSFDVYVQDADDARHAAALKLFDAISAYFEPGETATHAFERGAHRLTESLNDTTGFYIKATRQLAQRKSPYQRLSVYETPQYGRVIRLDGSNLTSEREAFVSHENLIHPTLTTHNAPKKVLIIGGGDGGAAEEVLKHPSIEQVTLVEADEDVLRLAKEHLHAVHRGAFDDPRLRVAIADGVRFVREQPEKYDMIALDVKHPMKDNEALYSGEFLQQLRQSLLPGGALVLHIGAPTAQPERVSELSQRLNAVFRMVRPYTVFVPLYGVQWAMAVCSDKLDPKAFTADEVDRRIEQRKLQDLRFYNGETHEGVFALPNFIRDLVAPPRLKTTARGRRLGLVQAAVK